MADDDDQPQDGGDGDQSRESKRAQEVQENWEKASEKMREMEEKDDPPSDLSEWPDDEGKYVTYGGGEGDHGYDEGPEKKLGPSSLEHHEDGSVTIEGEKVDNPEDYKADEPIGTATEIPGHEDKEDD